VAAGEVHGQPTRLEVLGGVDVGKLLQDAVAQKRPEEVVDGVLVLNALLHDQFLLPQGDLELDEAGLLVFGASKEVCITQKCESIRSSKTGLSYAELLAVKLHGVA